MAVDCNACAAGIRLQTPKYMSVAHTIAAAGVGSGNGVCAWDLLVISTGAVSLLDGDRCLDMRVRLVAEDFEIVEFVIENRIRDAIDLQLRQHKRGARQLFAHLFHVVRI